MKKSRSKTREYEVKASTPNISVKNTILSAVDKVKWLNTKVEILKENGSIVLITTIETLDVKKLFRFFDSNGLDGTINRRYD